MPLLLPISAYPWDLNKLSLSGGNKNNVKTVMVDEVINGLTIQPKENKSGSNLSLRCRRLFIQVHLTK